jgi:hypothetical protein
LTIHIQNSNQLETHDQKSLNLKRSNIAEKQGGRELKRSLAVGLMLTSIFLALSFGVAFAEKENTTTNMTLPENLTNMTLPKNMTNVGVTNVNTNTIVIQNNSLNLILIRDMTEVININMLQNATNATKNISVPQNLS